MAFYGAILVLVSVVGAVIWIIWARRKIAVLQVKAATVEEQVKTTQENLILQNDQKIVAKAKQSQIETQQELIKINSQITTLKQDYEIKLKKVNEALTWEDLNKI